MVAETARRRPPLSLRARLLLILLLALLAVQVLSMGAVGWSRGQGARHLVNGLIARDVLQVHDTLQALSADGRAAALQALARADYRWQLLPAADTLPAEPATRLQDLVQRVDGERPGLGVRAVRWQAEPALRLRLADGQDLVVVLTRGLPASTPPAGLALAWLAAVTLAVAGVAWLAVTLATRPLAQAADAARAMAANLDSPPMPEQGPPELAGLARAMNALQQQVQRQLAARTRILAAVSHDLKTPITRLQLRAASLPEGAERQRLEHDLDAMSALVDEGLAYARSEQLHEARSPVDLNALLENIVEQAQDMGQDCRYVAQPLAPLTVAPRALARLLQNLVDNAIRYGGQAEIEVQPLGDEIELRVGDRGPGLPTADLERLFEPFVRGDPSRARDSGGTGLGLAIARNIAQSLGGRLWLEPRPGGGLLARLRLPARP